MVIAEPMEPAISRLSAPTISVIGGNTADGRISAMAHEVGERLAKAGATLVCGGLGGVMESACKGARSAGGLTVGILPGLDRSAANPYVQVAVPTGLGLVRNNLVVFSGDAVIAVDGKYGTLNEMTVALNHGIPVVSLHSWDLTKSGVDPSDLHLVETPEEAVGLALKLAGGRK